MKRVFSLSVAMLILVVFSSMALAASFDLGRAGKLDLNVEARMDADLGSITSLQSVGAIMFVPSLVVETKHSAVIVKGISLNNDFSVAVKPNSGPEYGLNIYLKLVPTDKLQFMVGARQEKVDAFYLDGFNAYINAVYTIF